MLVSDITDGSSIPTIEGSGPFARLFNICKHWTIFGAYVDKAYLLYEVDSGLPPKLLEQGSIV